MHLCVSFLVCSVWETRCMDTRAVAMQCNASLHGWDVGPRDVPQGMSPGPSIRQRLLVYFFLHCFRSLSIFGEGNGGCIGH